MPGQLTNVVVSRTADRRSGSFHKGTHLSGGILGHLEYFLGETNRCIG